MNNLFLSLFVGLLILFASVSLYAMRCNGGIINEGDTAVQAYTTCGSPDFKTGDAWGDRQTWTYKLDDGSVWSVYILNDVVQSIDMSR